MSSTLLRRVIRAPRAQVYRALIDGPSVAIWMVPDGMTSQVHCFDGSEGGAFRISLTYTDEGAGKTSGKTDTFHGRFDKLVPDSQVVQTVEFETSDPAMQGAMTITYTLVDFHGGTELVAVHEDLPAGLSPADNEQGWTMSLAKLAKLVESAA